MLITYIPQRFYILAHLGFRFIVVISLISCSSRKEKLGSNTPINFITSWRFSPEVGPQATSGDSADSAGPGSVIYKTRCETTRWCRLQCVIKKRANWAKLREDESAWERTPICCSESYLYLLLQQLVMNQLESMAGFCHDLYSSSQALQLSRAAALTCGNAIWNITVMLLSESFN